MRSYVSIDRIEGDYAVCEVELISIEKSIQTDPFDKETEMIDLPVKYFRHYINEEPVEEGDIFIVEYDEVANVILWVYKRDDEERIRRLKIIENLVKKIR